MEREREREVVELPDDDTTKQHFLIYIEFSVHVYTMTRRDEQTDRDFLTAARVHSLSLSLSLSLSSPWCRECVYCPA